MIDLCRCGCHVEPGEVECIACVKEAEAAFEDAVAHYLADQRQ